MGGPTNPEIRALTPLDAHWLHHLHGEAFDTPWSSDSFAQLLALPTVQGWAIDFPDGHGGPGGPGFILTQNSGGEGEILTFQVAKAVRGQGMGRRLLAHALAHLADGGVASVFLEVAEDRRSAKKLYENQGFRLEGRRKNYYKTRSGRTDAEVWMLTF